MLFIPTSMIIRSDPKNKTLSGFMNSAYNFKTTAETLAMIFYSEESGAMPLLTTSSIAGALFGAVQCLAWHFSFPSRQVMWKSASLGVVVSCTATFLTVMCEPYISRLYGIHRVLCYLCTAPFAIATFIYPVARITLLVLALTSLRFLPTSTLDTIDWVELVPHI